MRLAQDTRRDCLAELARPMSGRQSSVVRILRSGILAKKFCLRDALAHVAAVFARSFYLRAGETFVCVGDASIGNGPLTLIADFGGTLSALGFHAGQPARMRDDSVAIGSVRLALDRSLLWRPPAWPVAGSPIRLIDTCSALACRAAVEAPPEGFARLLFGEVSAVAESVLSRYARARIASFEAWLADMSEHPGVATTPAPIDGLIGLGPGLTPAGDDFLLGALALLDALGARAIHATLAHAVTRLAPARTSALSACFLAAGAAGHVGENLHQAVASVVCGKVDTAIAAVRAIGHSSGWDMLAGIAATLRVVAARVARPPLLP